MSIFKPARSLFFTVGVLSTVPLAAFAIRGEEASGTAAPGEPPGAVRQEETPNATSGGQTRTGAAAAESPPFDVNDVIRRVRFSYREEADGWHAGHPGYDVHASAGALTLTPIHQAPAEPPELGPKGPAPARAAEVVEGPPLVLGAARVTRGSTRLDAETARGEVEADGHLALERGAVVEHLRNSEAGVEQSWSFEDAPPGTGELEVEIPTDGLVYTMSTPQGLHFADARTGLGFQYGHGTWIDAEGRRTPVQAEYEDGHIQLRVPESVLAGSAYPAVLDPVISRELIVDGRLSAADNALQEDPAIAYDGTNFLVVWRTRRGNGYSLYGARISDIGTLLDPQGFALADGVITASDASVASNGDGFFVLWNASEPDTRWYVRGTRVGADGVVAERGGRVIAAAAGRDLNFPRLATNGTDYMATWYVSGGYGPGEGSDDVIARRFDAAGEQVGEEIAISTSPTHNETLPFIASNGDGYLVTWSDDREAPPGEEGVTYRARAARVSNEGAVLDPGGFRLSGETVQYAYGVASNGQDYLAVWLDYGNWSTREVRGTRVTASGAVADGAGLAIGGGPGAFASYSAAGSDGTDYFVAWTASVDGAKQQTRGTRVSSSLAGQSAVIDYPGVNLSPPNGHLRPALAHSGAGYLVVWDGVWDDRPGRRELYHCRIPGTLPERIPLTGVSSDQTDPAVASSGDNYLVVWTDTGAAGNTIYGARVAPDGTLLDQAPLNIATAPRERGYPSVASNGQDYLVSWMDFRDVNWDIFGARVLGGAAGQSAVVDPNGFAISRHPEFQNAPDVASDGTDYLVVWRQAQDGRGNVHGARVTSAGAVLDPAGIAIQTNVAEHYTPRAAGNEDGYLVVWAEYRDFTSWDVLGRRVSTAGAVMDASPLVVSNGAREQYDPDVASDGTGYLVVWTDYRSNTSNDVYGARVTAGGVTLDPAGIVISVNPAQQVGPKVAFDGINYVAAWVDQRWSQNWSVIGTAVSAGGAVLQPDGWSSGWELGAPAGLSPVVAVAGSGDGRMLTAYPKYDVWPNQGNRRIRGTVGSFSE